LHLSSEKPVSSSQPLLSFFNSLKIVFASILCLYRYVEVSSEEKKKQKQKKSQPGGPITSTNYTIIHVKGGAVPVDSP
jgi:hypothetical protein